MVETQLVPRGIADGGVLEAMRTVPREEFVPAAQRSSAYYDGAFPIGRGQTISQPYMVALMTQSLRVDDSHRVLEIGTGSGYQAAILAELAGHVYTVERIPELAQEARERLCERLGYANISFLTGDGTLGWLEEAPFDRIMVTAGAPHEPGALLGELVPGGIMVVPVGGDLTQSLMRYSKDEKERVKREHICDCVFVKLIGEDGW